MQAINRLAGVLAVAAMAWANGAAAQQNLTLPEVSVTAPSSTPPAPPSGAASAGGMPFFGNARVEETKWPEIPCSSSRVGATAGTCRRGPQQINFEHGDGQGSRQLSNCQIAHDLVIGTLGGLSFEADSLVFDPYYISAIGHQRQDCYVEALPSHLRNEFADMNQVTRQGGNWRNFVDGGDLITMEFSVGTDNCLALERRGPRWGGGYIWLIHASICRRDGRPVDTSNIGSVLGTLQIQQRDAAGNLSR
jgi:hypothetical protein